ncbi:MAG TPA: hypothetical protein VFA22_05030 [Stellaceae bacterium]|nr:hypothetical protein [Stellaceae bacterium]
MRRGLDGTDLSPGRFAALFAVLYATAAVPVARTLILPLVDYPNHLARMALLARLPHDPALGRFYALAWRPIPDLAMDLLVPPLLRVLPLATAGRVFVLLAFLLIAGGAALLYRVLFGRWSAWAALAFLLLYNRLLLWGLLNDLFGLGLALVALALSIALRGRGIALRLVAGTVVAFALYFAHLMAFGVFAVLWLGCEAGFVWRERGAGILRLCVAVLPLLLPAGLMLASGTGEGGMPHFAPPWRKLDLLFSVFDLYHRPFDVACFAVAVLGLGLAYWRRWLVVAPPLGLPLALLGLAYLAMPTDIAGATGVDRRLPLALALVLAGGSTWVAPRPRLERAYLAAAAVMFLLRLGTVAASWEASDRAYRALLAGLDAIPRGSLVAVAYPPAALNVSATPLAHFAVLAAARRDAFVPTLFARPTQQPVVLRPPFRALADRTSPDRLWAAFAAGTLTPAAVGPYDVIVLAGVAPIAAADPAGFIPLFRAPRFRIYRIARPAGAS